MHRVGRRVDVAAGGAARPLVAGSRHAARQWRKTVGTSTNSAAFSSKALGFTVQQGSIGTAAGALPLSEQLESVADDLEAHIAVVAAARVQGLAQALAAEAAAGAQRYAKELAWRKHTVGAEAVETPPPRRGMVTVKGFLNTMRAFGIHLSNRKLSGLVHEFLVPAAPSAPAGVGYIHLAKLYRTLLQLLRPPPGPRAAQRAQQQANTRSGVDVSKMHRRAANVRVQLHDAATIVKLLGWKLFVKVSGVVRVCDFGLATVWLTLFCLAC